MSYFIRLHVQGPYFVKVALTRDSMEMANVLTLFYKATMYLLSEVALSQDGLKIFNPVLLAVQKITLLRVVVGG